MQSAYLLEIKQTIAKLFLVICRTCPGWLVSKELGVLFNWESNLSKEKLNSLLLKITITCEDIDWWTWLTELLELTCFSIWLFVWRETEFLFKTTITFECINQLRHRRSLDGLDPLNFCELNIAIAFLLIFRNNSTGKILKTILNTPIKKSFTKG